MRTGFVLLLLMLGACCASARTWTDSLGRGFEAEFIRSDGAYVVLNVGGLQRRFLLSGMSESDQEWMRRGGAGKGAPEGSGRGKSSEQKLPKSAPRKPSKSEIQVNQSIPVTRIEANFREKRWVYASPHFEFVCDEDLGLPIVREFVWMFESVWQFCEQWPVRLPRLESKEQVRMRTLLVKNYEDYVRLGGIPNSGGCYIPGRDLILVPFRSLGIEAKGSKYKISRSLDNNILRHEITHQLMRGQTQQAAWFIEGAAEYVSSVPYSVNRLLVSQHANAVVSYIIKTNYLAGKGRPEGRTMKLSSLEKFMTGSYDDFQKTPHAYSYGLLLFYYFAKLEGKKGGEQLRLYTEALHRDKSEVEARSILLRGRSWKQLEKEIAAAWNLRGIRLRFVE
jgi:hypothetical protein